MPLLISDTSCFHFNPRSSCEERHPECLCCRKSCNFNPRSSCEERPCAAVALMRSHHIISIHAPHARSDAGICAPRHVCIAISIHAPHARSDGFLLESPELYISISIHAPHARSDAVFVLPLVQGLISIHAPHARSDARRVMLLLVQSNFNPRSSCEERRHAYLPGRQARDISIHAPHARSDSTEEAAPALSGYFNPRSSCEERPYSGRLLRADAGYFNPRSSCEERLASRISRARWIISIHAPHARSDPVAEGRCPGPCHFNPRSSCEERHSGRLLRADAGYFNPRSSCEERRLRHNGGSAGTYFNPRSSCEERLLLLLLFHAYFIISIHAPHARSDMPTVSGLAMRLTFQSTLLMRGATRMRETRSSRSTHFNPRSSCEERRFDKRLHRLVWALFQSTLLMRGATSPPY